MRGCVPWPSRVVQNCSSDRDKVSIAGCDDRLRLLAAKLNPGGVLLVTTGDWGSIAARVMGAAWRLMTPPQHLFYFTAGSLELLGRQHGLSIASQSRPWKTVPLFLVAYQAARMTRFDRRAPTNGSVLSGIGIPVNLFDTLRVVFRKT